jgi:hypothetical protein
MVEGLHAVQADDAQAVAIVCIRVRRGRVGSMTPAHQLDAAGRGPYWCDQTRKFSREIRVLDGKILCGECPTQVLGMSGLYGRVVGLE